jgi:hypothetical protein
MVRFCNSIVAVKPDTLHYKVLMSDLRLAIVDGRETFGGTLMQQFWKIGYYIADMLHYEKVASIDISLVKDLLAYQNG